MKRALPLLVAFALLVSCQTSKENPTIQATAEIMEINFSHDTLPDGGFKPITEVSYYIITPAQFKGRTLTYGYPGLVDEQKTYVGKIVEIEFMKDHLNNLAE